MRAKINVAQAIEDGDKGMTLWYLEHAVADEFSAKQQIAIANPYRGLTK